MQIEYKNQHAYIANSKGEIIKTLFDTRENTMTTEEIKDEAKRQVAEKMHKDYGKILPKDVIEASIAYWNILIDSIVDKALQSKVKSIREEIEKRIAKTIEDDHAENRGDIDAIGYLGDIRWKDMDNILSLPSLQLLDDNDE